MVCWRLASSLCLAALGAKSLLLNLRSVAFNVDKSILFSSKLLFCMSSKKFWTSSFSFWDCHLITVRAFSISVWIDNLSSLVLGGCFFPSFRTSSSFSDSLAPPYTLAGLSSGLSSLVSLTFTPYSMPSSSAICSSSILPSSSSLFLETVFLITKSLIFVLLELLLVKNSPVICSFCIFLNFLAILD